jgi:hypothetical protein
MKSHRNHRLRADSDRIGKNLQTKKRFTSRPQVCTVCAALPQAFTFGTMSRISNRQTSGHRQTRTATPLTMNSRIAGKVTATNFFLALGATAQFGADFAQALLFGVPSQESRLLVPVRWHLEHGADQYRLGLLHLATRWTLSGSGFPGHWPIGLELHESKQRRQFSGQPIPLSSERTGILLVGVAI